MGSLNTDGKAIFQVLIGALIAIAFLSTIANSINLQTNTFSVANGTVTAPAVNGTLDLTGRTLVGTGRTENVTDGVTIVGAIISTQTGSNGLRTVQLTINDTSKLYAGKSVNVTYTYEPDGYLNNSGARSISLLVIIIGALAILVFVIVIFIKNGTLGKIMRKS